MSMSIRTDEAVQMLAAGWKAEYDEQLDAIAWSHPRIDYGNRYVQQGRNSLDNPPDLAIQKARELGQIKDRPRVPENVQETRPS